MVPLSAFIGVYRRLPFPAFESLRYTPPMRRRHFLELSVGTIGGVLVYSLDRHPQLLNAQAVRIPLRFFTDGEARIVAAAAARIFPSDDAGPGAQRSRRGDLHRSPTGRTVGRDRARYTQRSLRRRLAGVRLSGQSNAARNLSPGAEAAGRFRRTSTAAAAGSQALRQIETTPFFTLLRRNTIEGMFCDPMHGGNADMVGWQLIGFPGPRMSNSTTKWTSITDEAFRPKPAQPGTNRG